MKAPALKVANAMTSSYMTLSSQRDARRLFKQDATPNGKSSKRSSLLATIQCASLLLLALSGFNTYQAHADEKLHNQIKNSGKLLSRKRTSELAFQGSTRESNSLGAGAVAYPKVALDTIDVRGNLDGDLHTNAIPSFKKTLGDRYAASTPNNNIVFYSLEPDLQEFVHKTISRAAAPHAAIVVMNPSTGAILAIAGKSKTIQNIEYHTQFPAASLFKIVTAAAAIEESNVSLDTKVAFRGGTYTLNKWNYLPNAKKDRRLMSVGEAMGRSCNPVFGHIALKHLDGSILSRYAHRFGFNQSLGFEAPLDRSSAHIPHTDKYQLSRTAAGFGDVTISPIHAAALVSGVANGGLLPRPYFVERIASADGATILRTQPEYLQRIVQPETAHSLLEMMHYTTTIGTSRKAFMRGKKPVLGDIEVAAKTGTLRGKSPEGLNNWFIATAPMNNPQVAIAVITVNAKYSSKASYLGRSVLQKFFEEKKPTFITRASLNTQKLPK